MSAERMKLLAAVTFSVLLLPLPAGLVDAGAASTNPENSDSAVTLYDANPGHMWNRFYEALFIRSDASGAKYGSDALDPLLWSKTEHLLAGPSHQRALSTLDEFLRTHAENQIHDPLKKALLQRNLWAVFDWSALGREDHAKERQELQIRLAEVLRRLALTEKEIKSLPDNYAQAVASGTFAREFDAANPERAFLPPDLFQARGPWVCIQGDLGPVAATHVSAFSGRSRFLVFVHLPQGRKATLEYFQSLWNVAEPWVGGELDAAQGALNPKLPQIPVGTQVALVRQMTLFDKDGKLVATPITESVEIRVYHAITARQDHNNTGVDWPAARKEQGFYELRLSQAQLFAGQAGGLRAVARGEKDLPVFQTQGEDAFEVSAREHGVLENRESMSVLDRCAACHSAPGINSLQSRRALLKPNHGQLDPEPPYDARAWETEYTLDWKAKHYDWGLLNGYWQASK